MNYFTKIKIIIFSTFIFTNTLAHHPDHKVEAQPPYPTLNLEIFKDSIDGYNLYIKLNNFKLTPRQINKNNEPDVGYLNLYINDIKVARIYSNWAHLPKRYFNFNENIIKVTLNTNMHGNIHLNGKAIQANIIITKE